MGRKSNKAKEKKQARLAERAAMDAVCAKVDAANKTTSSRAKRCMTISGCRLVFRKIRTWSLPSHYSICMSDVADNVHEQSQTKRSKLDKEYKFFHKQYIFNYQVSNIIDLEEAVVVRTRCHRSMRSPIYCRRFDQSPLMEWLRKPMTSGRGGIRSTIYQAFPVPLPDMMVLSAGPSLRSMRLQPAIAKVLHGQEEISLVL